MDIGEALDKLGIRLSRLLRYSYGGFLLLGFAALLNPTDAKPVLDAMGWELAALSAIAVGAGIYATHRSVVIPLQHLLLTWLLSPSVDSPTRWLGSIGVPFGWRMFAYSTIRRSQVFDDRQVENWNVAHAESGLIVMTAEGFVLAALYAWRLPLKSRIDAGLLLALGIVFLVCSFVPGFGQHRLECRRFRDKRADIEGLLKRCGLLPSTNGAA